MIALPRHVAIIMDGNGRWAAERGLPRHDGHRRGAEAVRRVVRAARELGLPALTLYAFSAQNWERPRNEVGHLMRLLGTFAVDEAPELLARGIRVVTIGDLERLPLFARAPLLALEAASAHNREMVLCLALSYGGREAITSARCPPPSPPGACGLTRSRSSGSRRDWTPARCRRWTCWSARRASFGCRTSFCGRPPTPSSTSPRCSGPTSTARRWRTRSPTTLGASAASV
jgi:hypothetical protein